MTTRVPIRYGGTGANTAPDARTALGVPPLAAYDVANNASSTANAAYSQANAAYGQANAAYNAANNAKVTVYSNNASNVTTQNVNFVNTATVTVSVTADGSNANIAFTAAPQTVVNDTYTAAGNTAAAATANIANGLFAISTSAYDQANAAYGQANTAYGQANDAYGQANTAYSQANSAYAEANLKLNLTGGTINGNLVVTGTANASALNVTNVITASRISLSNTGTAVDASQGNILTNQVTGTQFNFLSGLYTATVTGGGSVASDYTLRLPPNLGSNGQVFTSDGTGNTSWTDGGVGAAFNQANDAYAQANTARGTANSAYGQANNAYGQANDAYAAANTANTNALAAYGQANLAYTQANAAYNQANAAYAEANLKLNLTGGTINGSLNVSGNLTITGNTSYINVSTLNVTDPLIFLAANNDTSDIVDIGFVGGKNTGGTFNHTGLARDAGDGTWYLFDNLADAGHVNNVIDFANTTLALLRANINANSILLTGNAVATQANLTLAHDQANAAYNAANNAKVTVFANNGSNVTTQNINFVNTATIAVVVSSNGSNANISLNSLVGAQNTVIYVQSNTLTSNANTFYLDFNVAGENYVSISKNGLVLTPNSHYYVVNANTIILSTEALVNDTITFTYFLDIANVVDGNVLSVAVAAYNQANAARGQANAAYGQANDAYTAANNRVLKSGDTMTGNLNVAATLITQNVVPNLNVTYDLGTSTKRFKDLWLSNSTIYLGNTTISANGDKLVVPALELASGANLSNAVLKTGDTMTGQLNIADGGLIVHSDDSERAAFIRSPTRTLRITPYYNQEGNDKGTWLEAINTSNAAYNKLTLSGSNIILDAGKVGVGVNAPSSPLDIKADDVTTLGITLRAMADEFASLRILNNSGTSTYGELAADYGGSPIYLSSAGDISLKTNNNDRVYITGNGNVGIGTTDPTSNLHVVGTANVSANLSLGAGSSASPSLTKNGDTDTGVYFPANNEVAITAGGTVAAAFNSNGLFFRNRIINGDMRIDQRNAGAAVTASGTYPVDRFFNQYGAGTLTFQQSSSIIPTGFTQSLGVTVTSAGTRNAGDYYAIITNFEGNNISDWGLGSAGALTTTLSFWVRSSVTGLYSGVLNSGDNNRSYAFNYTISSANTWEKKTIAIAGDTSGGTTAYPVGTGVGLRLRFDLGSGSNYQITADSWQAQANKLGTSGTVNWAQTAGATLYITGVQLETGSVATPFERRPFGTELQLCQRYYEKSYDYATAAGSAVAEGYSAMNNADQGSAVYIFNVDVFKVTKRVAANMRFWDLAGNLSRITDFTLGGLGRTDGRNSVYSYIGNVQNARMINVQNASTVGTYQWDASAEL